MNVNSAFVNYTFGGHFVAAPLFAPLKLHILHSFHPWGFVPWFVQRRERALGEASLYSTPQAFLNPGLPFMVQPLPSVASGQSNPLGSLTLGLYEAVSRNEHLNPGI